MLTSDVQTGLGSVHRVICKCSLKSAHFEHSIQTRLKPIETFIFLDYGDLSFFLAVLKARKVSLLTFGKKRHR